MYMYNHVEAWSQVSTSYTIVCRIAAPTRYYNFYLSESLLLLRTEVSHVAAHLKDSIHIDVLLLLLATLTPPCTSGSASAVFIRHTYCHVISPAIV